MSRHLEIDSIMVDPEAEEEDGLHQGDYSIVNGTTKREQNSFLTRLGRRSLSWLTWMAVTAAIAIVGLAVTSPPILQSWKQHHQPTPARLFYRPEDSDDNSRWTFTILQLADLHLGEAQNTVWGPKQDNKTWKALETFLGSPTSSYNNKNNHTAAYDLIVLSGDQLTANDFFRRNATTYYLELGRRLVQYQTPFAIVFGNHDDKPNDATGVAATSRIELLRVLQRHFPSWCVTQPGPSHVTGVSNYWLNIHAPQSSSSSNDNDNDIVTRLVFLDSGGGSLPQQIDNSHLSFLVQGNARYNTMVPTMAFSHIPTQEYAFSTNYCVGENNDGGIATPTSGDAGLVRTLQHNLSNVFALAVGHNHGNDYCCSTNNDDCTTPASSSHHDLHLCFGRHSGYGGYGSWDRGVRMYEFRLLNNNTTGNQSQQRQFSWKSWVSMESGQVQDEYGPYQIR